MTVAHQFTIHAKEIVGYYAQGARPNWTRKEQYVEWKKYVQAVAKVSGIRLPLVATETEPVRITTKAWFRNRTHPDSENVHKGIVDSLFYKAKGGDKYTAGAFSWPQYDADDPRVEVTIERVWRA